MTGISVDSAAVAQGLGLFETLLVLRGRAVHPDAHFTRMAASCAVLGFPLPDQHAFLAEVENAATRCEDEEAALRCVYVASGADPRDAGSWTLAATTGALPTVTVSRRAHGRVVTLDPAFTRALPNHKLTSYAACVVALRIAIEAGADEGLFVTRDGRVLEGTSTNVFAVDGQTIITAAPEDGILPGIVRAWVIDTALELGFRVDQRPPAIEELRRGSFLTSSLTLLAPIRQLDGVPCRWPGEGFERLAARMPRSLERS